LGGKFDPRNPSHKMLMSVLGGMSESERQHVQARVRAAMDAQVINEGRHQGGRAPYGYLVVDGGPHPNPRKASEGYRLRLLAIDESVAEVVRRIFAEYLDGAGDRAIANGLNRDAIRVRLRCGRSRTGTGSPMGGRAARCGRFWRTHVIPAMRCSVGGPSRKFS
jgi:DNA invertase Pin-like site-specific DNA recombinase